MSDERLDELGLPRRMFLKRTAAAAAFIAPVIVSFGLDSTAEATPGFFPNQCRPNQTIANQFVVEQELLVVIERVLQALQQDQIDFFRATFLCEQALFAALEIASGRLGGVCPTLSALVNELREESPALPEALQAALFAQRVAGCVCAV